MTIERLRIRAAKLYDIYRRTGVIQLRIDAQRAYDDYRAHGGEQQIDELEWTREDECVREVLA